MSIFQFPPGSWAALDQPWPTATQPGDEIEQDANPAFLFAITVAYQRGLSASISASQWLGRDLWLHQQPVTDPQLGAWMHDWDQSLASSSAALSGATESWGRQVSLQFGVHLPPIEIEPIEIEPERTQNVEKWLDSDWAEMDEDLHNEAEALIKRLRESSASMADLARSDRLPWLHSPVIKGRTALGAGGGLEEVEPSIDGMTDAAMRTTEYDTIKAINWPTFKDGRALMAKRVTTAGACGWCRVVATRLYSLESMRRGGSWHLGCRCVMVPVTAKEAAAYGAALKHTGSYFDAARRIGLWTGEGGTQEHVGERFDPRAAAEAGYISTRGDKVYDPASGSYV